MPSMKAHMNKWLGIQSEADVSHLGSGCATCLKQDNTSVLDQKASTLNQEVVYLRDLQPGDRFVVEGLDRVREVIRRQGDFILTKDVLNLNIEEMVLLTRVVKAGHRPGGPTVCDGLPKDTKDTMIEASDASYNRFISIEADKLGEPAQKIYAPREMGAVITDDYALGEMKTGSKDRVDIPRKGDNIIGTFHTHPGGNVRPGDFDLIDMLSHNDKIQCICSTATSGTKCQCYTPHEPQWTQLRQELNSLLDDIRKFNKETHSKYGLKGKSLRKFLRGVGTEAYLRTGLPYEVIRLPGGRAEGGGLKPIETRQVIGEVPITIEQKQETYSRWRGADVYATQLESEFDVAQGKVDAVVQQLQEAEASFNSLKTVADTDGQYITIYRLDEINDPAGIQALRDEAGTYPRGFQMSQIPFSYHILGDRLRYQDVTRQLITTQSEISNIRSSMREVEKLVVIPASATPAERDALIQAKRDDLMSQVNELYRRKNDLEQEQWITRPIEQSFIPQLNIVLVDESRIPIETNDAAEGLAPLDKAQLTALIDQRAAQIKKRDDTDKAGIAGAERQLEELIGTLSAFPVDVGGKTEWRQAYSGGRAQQYRDIIRDTTKSEKDRRLAGVALDNFDRQATQIRRVLKELRRQLKENRRPGPGAKAVRYGPDIEGLLNQIAGYTKQIHDMQNEVTNKRIDAQTARDTAVELKAEVDVLAKNRTTEYNDAVAIVQRGNNLEVRRQDFLAKLRTYEAQSSLFPEDLDKINSRLFSSCRLIWEEDTLSADELELDVYKLIENLMKARTVRIKATGKTGQVKSVKGGIYTVTIDNQDFPFTTEELTFPEE